MAVSVEKDAFSGMDEAYDVLKARKLWPMTSCNAFLERETPHWHPYDNTILVIEGEANFYAGADQELVHATPGDIINVPARSLHAVEAPTPVTFLVCFDRPVRRDEIVNNPPEALES
ncbi:MAG: cupin domain-containing protein [Alphaproteobacteria bacterium]